MGHHVLLLREQLVIHLRDSLGEVPGEPGVPLNVGHGDALCRVGHQNALQQVLALGRHLLVVGQLVVHAQDALQCTTPTLSMPAAECILVFVPCLAAPMEGLGYTTTRLDTGFSSAEGILFFVHLQLLRAL